LEIIPSTKSIIIHHACDIQDGAKLDQNNIFTKNDDINDENECDNKNIKPVRRKTSKDDIVVL
jgi:hypothetical protein